MLTALSGFEDAGAEFYPSAFDPKSWMPVVGRLPTQRPGVRLHGIKELDLLVAEGSLAHALARDKIGDGARPVRAILFDKGDQNNWPLGWHQDRTIALKKQSNADGFGPWTTKGGLTHAEPPFELISRMVTLRLHIDAVDRDNAPLRIAPGSHKLGRIPSMRYETVVNKLGEYSCLANAGDIWVYRTSILHASHTAMNPSSRRVIQIDYSADQLPHPLEWAGV